MSFIISIFSENVVWCKHSTNSFTKQLFKRTQCWIQIHILKKTDAKEQKHLFIDGNKVILATLNWSISFLFGSLIFMNLSYIVKTEYPFCYFSVLLKLKQLHYSPGDIFPSSLIETNASTEASTSTASTFFVFKGYFFVSRGKHTASSVVYLDQMQSSPYQE